MKQLVWGLMLSGCAFTVAGQAVVTASNVRLNSSAGTRIVVQGGISFTGTSNFIDNGRVDLLANPSGAASNWSDGTAGGVYDASGNGTVVLGATTLQTITGPTRFFTLTVDNAAGATLAGSNIEVRNILNLNNGLFTTGANTIFVSNNALNAIQTTSAATPAFSATYVDGRLERSTNLAGVDYLFPVGKFTGGISFYAPVQLNKINTSTARYTAEYFRGVPHDRTNRQSPPIDKVSVVEYWYLVSDAAAGSTADDAAVSLSWRNGSGVSTTPADRDQLMVAHYRNNVGFRWEPEFNTLAANIVSGTTAFGFVTTNVTVGSFTVADRRFTLATRIPNNVLPLTRFSWNASARQKTVVINWEVENDSKVEQYEVERSNNGVLFTSIARTNARKTSGLGTYESTDTQPADGWNYYRIRITDQEGKLVYSDVKKLWFHSKGVQSIFPNPAVDVLYVQLAADPAPGASIRIMDVTGRVVYLSSVLLRNNRIPVNQLIPGNYVLQYVTDGAVQSHQFIKVSQ